ncbi:MAG: sodium-dependent transporter, partial [Eubacterium sp.]|nr:sodium-dependent transporter [Eubacterium sp.]
KGTLLMTAIMIGLGSLSSLGYGPLADVTILDMQFLDFFDFLTNSIMMPVAALAICILVTRHMGIDRVEEEVMLNGHPFRRRRIFRFMIRFLCPFFVIIILLSSVANVLGIIKM